MEEPKTEDPSTASHTTKPVVSSKSVNYIPAAPVLSRHSVPSTLSDANNIPLERSPESSPATRNVVFDADGVQQRRQTYKERAKAFYEAVYADTLIDFQKLIALSANGIPDYPGLRQLYWRILLGYLPANREEWTEWLDSHRTLYSTWVRELMVDPRLEEEYKDRNNDLSQSDHPLNTSQTSKWKEYFKDAEMMHEIDKDVRRTFPHLHFFNYDEGKGSTEHYQCLRRILFIYAKLNPGLGYVQGMNELLGPIYYIFAIDPDDTFRVYAEQDAFYCFKNLMSEVMNNFIKSLDKTGVGINAWVSRLNALLKLKDYSLWQNLEDKGLKPQFYSFRWLTLLLSQEFELPDVLTLWDCLFADPNRFDLLLYCCLAMLICVRDQLFEGDFADNLKLLQKYPPIDVHHLLHVAKELDNGLVISTEDKPHDPLKHRRAPKDVDFIENMLRRILLPNAKRMKRKTSLGFAAKTGPDVNPLSVPDAETRSIVTEAQQPASESAASSSTPEEMLLSVSGSHSLSKKKESLFGDMSGLDSVDDSEDEDVFLMIQQEPEPQTEQEKLLQSLIS